MNFNAEKIVDSELEVMRVLWQHNEPVELNEILQVLKVKKGWKESTTKTIVRNLRIKGSIELISRGRYAAIVTESEFNEWSTYSFIKKMFDGSAKKLVVSLLSDGQLKEKDIAELYAELNGGTKNG